MPRTRERDPRQSQLVYLVFMFHTGAHGLVLPIVEEAVGNDCGHTSLSELE